MTLTTQSLYDPVGNDSLFAAVQWLQGTLLGVVATTVATLAVAVTGMRILAGRMDVRRAISVVAGCFIVFGASSIAAGFQSMVKSEVSVPSIYVAAESPLSERLYDSVATEPPSPYDPYAGASVPLE